ncbi:MAG: carbohydrate ABC transporter permease [Brevinematia bacterium]|jgi:multiple sugar transport system permease protein
MTNEKAYEEFKRRIRRKKIIHWLQNLLLLFFVIVFAFPIYWIFIGAFKQKGEFFHYPPIFFVNHFDFENFQRAFELGGAKGVRDSLIVATLNALLVLILALFAGYGIGRFKYGGPNLSFFVLSLLFAPPIIAVMPLFVIFKNLRLIDTYIALIFSYLLINLPFAIWLIKGFVEDLPEEIESAALVDGYTRFRAFWKVTFPLILPGVVVATLFVFVFAWNEFLFALIFTRSSVRTLPVVLTELIGGHGIQWGELSALSLVATIPSILLVIFFQRYLVRGLTFGAIKG